MDQADQIQEYFETEVGGPVVLPPIHISNPMRDENDVIQDAPEQDLDCFETFIGDLFYDNVVYDSSLQEQLLANPELQADFQKLIQHDLKGAPSDEEYLELRRKVALQLYQSIYGEDFDVNDETLSIFFDRTYNKVMYEARRQYMRNRILSCNNPQIIAEWVEKMEALNREYGDSESGISDPADYFARLSAIFTETIEKIGDSDLFEIWRAYLESEEGIDVAALFVEEGEEEEEEEPLLEEEEEEEEEEEQEVEEEASTDDVDIVATADQIEGLGYDVDAVGGQVDVYVDRTLPPISVSLMTSSSGKQFYRLNDDFIKEGKSWDVKPVDLSLKLYERYIDITLSSKLGKTPILASEVSELTDDNLIRVGKMMLGDRSKEGYKVDVESDLKVLELLAELLMAPDDELLGLEDKTEALNAMLVDYNRGNYVSEILFDGNAFGSRIKSITDLKKYIEVGESYA